MSFDNMAHTPPNTLRFKKKLSMHRGNPRIFFETTDIQPFGFVQGASDWASTFSKDRVNVDELVLVVAGDGERKVSKKVKGARTLSVIDINSALCMAGFKGEAEVLVTVTHNHISINKSPKE